MATTPSSMMPLGTIAPDFSLLDTISGKTRSLQELRSPQGTIVIFMCNHCPYVIHILPALAKLAMAYRPRGIATIAISANDANNYPADAPDRMSTLAAELGNPFAAYLYDETQAVAKAYGAVCTPEFYLFDGELRCVYRGRFDAATPKNAVPVTGEELRGALDGLLAGEAIPEADQHPSMGCSIKWKSA